MEIADLYSLHRMVTLKIMSRSPKSSQLFQPFQQCIHASLIKIHLLVQNIAHGIPILDILISWCDLQIRSRAPKSNQLFPFSQQYIYMLVWLKSIHWFRRTQKNLFWTFQNASVTLKIRSRSLNYNQLFLFSKQCIHASVVKHIHWFRRINMETLFWTIQKVSL